MADYECDWQANTDHMNDQLGEEGFGGEHSLWDGGEWDHDAAHHQVNRDAVKETAEQGMVEEDC